MQLLLADRQRGSNEKITHQFGKLRTTMKIPENCWEAQKFSKRYLGLRHQVQHLNFSCALHLGWSPHIQSGVLSTAPTIQGCGNVWNDRRYHVTNVTGIIPLQNPPGLVGCSPNRRWSQEVVLKLHNWTRGSDHRYGDGSKPWYPGTVPWTPSHSWVKMNVHSTKNVSIGIDPYPYVWCYGVLYCFTVYGLASKPWRVPRSRFS